VNGADFSNLMMGAKEARSFWDCHKKYESDVLLSIGTVSGWK
jgi:hypothetical protein